ncbi:MAG: hypothetical protein ACPG6B_04310 [Oceanihabitans sp.]
MKKLVISNKASLKVIKQKLLFTWRLLQNFNQNMANSAGQALRN